jgi:hypothetical protein
MTSKAERRRQRQKRAVERFSELAGRQTPANTEPPAMVEILRPTDQRMTQGVWHIAGQFAPAVDKTGGDMLGELYHAREIEKHHFDAGRAFQQLCALWQAELGIGSFRSCLDITGGGFDATDGNAALNRRYEAVKQRLGAARFLYLRTELDKGAGQRPKSVEVLRRALEGLATGGGEETA